VVSHITCRSPVHRGTGHKPSSAGPLSPEGRGCLNSPGKCSTPCGDTSKGTQAKRPRQAGQVSYTRATQEGLQMAIVCEDYPGTEISKENFVDVQQSIGRLVVDIKNVSLGAIRNFCKLTGLP
jgi:hypothetical protein